MFISAWQKIFGTLKTGKINSSCPLQELAGDQAVFLEQPAKDNFDAETFQKYNPEVSRKIKIYSFFQFLALAYVGLVVLESGELSYQATLGDR